MVETPIEDLARKRLGRTIKGKWRLDRLIGVGGMAAVYAATHRNGARVAIKMLHATISASSQIRARFVREGYLANKVDHGGVVRVLDDDVDDTDQAAFLVMDLVIGTTLSERGTERLLDEGEVLDVADQVLQVLAAAHEKGIIHRDLKPDNLLVDARGKVHVLDFGIARLLDDLNAPSATRTGTAFGTPGFMAPEQALGKSNLISARTDLYALGATLFALVSGDFVHSAESPQEMMVLVATQEARSLADLSPQTNRGVIALIDKAVRNRPEDRWASADEMLREVRRLKATLGLRDRHVLPLPPGVGAATSVVVTPSGEGSAYTGRAKLQLARTIPSQPLGRRNTRSPDSASTTLTSDLEPVTEPPSPSALDSNNAHRTTGAPSFSPAGRPRFLPLMIVGGVALVISIGAVIAVAARRPNVAPAASDRSHTAELATAPPAVLAGAASASVETTVTPSATPSSAPSPSAPPPATGTATTVVSPPPPPPPQVANTAAPGRPRAKSPVPSPTALANPMPPTPTVPPSAMKKPRPFDPGY